MQYEADILRDILQTLQRIETALNAQRYAQYPAVYFGLNATHSVLDADGLPRPTFDRTIG